LVYIINTRLLSAYLSQIVTVLSNILLIPFIVRCVGWDQYGYIAVYLLLFGWISLFEFGGTGAIPRILSKKNTDNNASTILSLGYIYFLISLLVFVVFLFILLFLYKNINFTTSLLIALTLALKLIEIVLKSISYSIFIDKIYNFYYVATNLARIVFISIFIYSFKSINFYFYFQVLFSIILILLMLHCIAKKISVPIGEFLLSAINFKPILKEKKIIKSLTINSLLVLTVHQIDKLFLIKYLTLKSISFFSIVMSIGGLLPMLTVPIMQLLIPKIIANKTSSKLLFDEHTKLVLLIPISIGCLLIIYQEFVTNFLIGSPLDTEQILFYKLIISGFILNSVYYLFSAMQVAYNKTSISNLLCSSYLVFLPFYLFLIPNNQLAVAGPYFLLIQIFNVILGGMITFYKSYRNLFINWWLGLFFYSALIFLFHNLIFYFLYKNSNVYSYTFIKSIMICGFSFSTIFFIGLNYWKITKFVLK
jgi:O-antigen/teichoic acid export membrane protein